MLSRAHERLIDWWLKIPWKTRTELQAITPLVRRSAQIVRARIYFYDSYQTITDILLRVRGGHEVEPYPQHPPAAEAAYNCGPRRRAPRRRDELQERHGDHRAGDA